jgi:hypothetical protein
MSGTSSVFDSLLMPRSAHPVEDIWLQAKRFIRKFFMLCKSFAVVKYLFEFVTHQQHFTFEKAFMYG